MAQVNSPSIPATVVRAVPPLSTVPQLPAVPAASARGQQPDLPALFDQLGLSSDAAHIESFLAAHQRQTTNCTLPDAPYWTPAQSAFLREALMEDSVWSAAADQLNLALHPTHRQPS